MHAQQESYSALGALAQSAGVWTTKQTADHLECAEVTLRTWRREGIGPVFIRIGRNVRYRPEDVRAWMSRQRATNTSAVTPDERTRLNNRKAHDHAIVSR